MCSDVREFVETCQAKRLSFSDADLSVEISLGIAVCDSKQYVAFLEFSPSDLVALGVLGISLSVVAYPASDEANEHEQE